MDVHRLQERLGFYALVFSREPIALGHWCRGQSPETRELLPQHQEGGHRSGNSTPGVPFIVGPFNIGSRLEVRRTDPNQRLLLWKRVEPREVRLGRVDALL